ncbi:hypothetical protein BDW42DRAFT_193071 [Aspergillus taichungensis]|uniref:F-box domain-containing protein n=1 Tax=Aspergillus taichungensis TaxID=482145 RepID=A0A2J5HYP0_9EURO|nr:hypothetical protein BDW42DRAFT_193071 [Aspergillus taichungensis]
MTRVGPVRSESDFLYRRAQTLCGQGNFAGALEAFTETLRCPGVDHLDVLDKRSAIYAKTGQYALAIKDAQRMIRNDRQDERGYLRCAKALVMEGKPEKALQLYTYALKYLPEDRPGRQLVVQLRDRIQAKLKTAETCCDPMAVLPLEIISMILGHLTFRQLVTLLRVSKKWNQFLSSYRELWRRIDLSSVRTRVPHTSVSAYIRRSNATLTYAIIKNLNNPSRHKVLEYLSRCRQLEYLEIWTPVECGLAYDLLKSAQSLRTLILSAEITVSQEYITKFLSSLPRLERFEIHRSTGSPTSKVDWPSHLPNLRSISLASEDNPIFSVHVPALFIPHRQRAFDEPDSDATSSDDHPIPNLEELRLHSGPPFGVPCPISFDPMGFARLRKLDLGGMYFGRHVGLPPTLESLRLRGGNAWATFPFADADDMDLPNLHTLVLSDVGWVTVETLHEFMVRRRAPVQILHVDTCDQLRGPALSSFLCEHGERLTELNVSHLFGINDAVMEPIAAHLRHLEVVNMSYTDVTGNTARRFVQESVDTTRRLKHINVKGCDSASWDSVYWGREQGVQIVK